MVRFKLLALAKRAAIFSFVWIDSETNIDLILDRALYVRMRQMTHEVAIVKSIQYSRAIDFDLEPICHFSRKLILPFLL